MNKVIRFLNEENIRISAKKDFIDFQNWMLTADAYMFEDDWSEGMLESFESANLDERRQIQENIINEKI